MSNLTWEEKLVALNALAMGHALAMRKPGDWYVIKPSYEVSRKGMLISEYGNGSSPMSAVDDHFAKIAESRATIIMQSFSSPRRAFRWNGFMWESVQEKTEEHS